MRAEQPRLATDDVIALGAQMFRAAAQHIVLTAAREAQHDVLCATAQRGDLLELAGRQTLLIHPVTDDGKVDDVAIHIDRLHNRHVPHCAPPDEPN